MEETYYLEIDSRPVILDRSGEPDLGEPGGTSIRLSSRQISQAESLFQRYGINPLCCCCIVALATPKMPH